MKHTRKFTALAVALFALLGSAKAADEGGELRRRAHNTAKLAEIHAPSRPKFRATLADLEAHGQRPYIVAAFRRPETQAAIKAAGNSRVPWSFHNARTPSGAPDALAMDVVDARYFWKTGGDFWLMYAAVAQGHALATGIRWGLPASERRRIDSLIARRDWHAKYKRGWDPGHAEATGVTLGQAQHGKRPEVRK